MLQRTILILILLHCINPIIGQQQYAESLLLFETEIFHSDKDTIDLIKLQKINFMLKSDSLYGQVLDEVQRVNFNLVPDTIRKSALWNATLLAYLNDDLDLSFLYWTRYKELTKDSSMQCCLLGYLITESRDVNLNRELYSTLAQQDSQFILLDNELHKSLNLKGAIFKKFSAFIIPGSGLMLNGNVGKGLISLSLNTGIVVFVRFLILNNAWVNTVLWGSNLIGKFYFGSYRLTIKEIELKDRRKKRMRAENSAQILDSILDKYPLNFQLVY